MLLRSESPSGKCAKLHNVAASNNRDHLTGSLYYCLFMPHIYGCYSSRTSRLWLIAHSTQHQPSGCDDISFLQQPTPIACSFCEGCTWHDLHILITAPFCCDRKAQAESAQNFTLWQQATIEITWQDHSIIACSYHIYMGVILHAHPVRGELHIQRNAKRDVATMLNGLSQMYTKCCHTYAPLAEENFSNKLLSPWVLMRNTSLPALQHSVSELTVHFKKISIKY